MFKDIFYNEVKYWFRKPVTYVYFAVFFSFAFLSFVGTAGLFDPPPENPQTSRVLNSPYEINYMLQYFGKVFLFLLPAIVGAAVYKDYRYQVHSVLYSFAIRKRDYLLGRFFGAITVVLLISFSVGLAFFIGEQIPGLHPDKIGAFKSVSYLQAYAFYIVPNLLVFGAIIFSVVLFTRNIYAGFITAIVFFLIQMILENALGSINTYLIALLDPFAQHATAYETQNWTLLERNTETIPVLGVVLLNRITLLGLAALIFISAYRKFQFHESLQRNWSFSLAKRSVKNKQKGKNTTTKLMPVQYVFSKRQDWKNILRLARIESAYILRSPMFLVLLFFGIVAILFTLGKVTNLNDITLQPSTRIMLLVPTRAYTMIIILLTFLYAGMLVNKSRSSKMHQLIDSTPTSNAIFLLSKILALINMQGILLLVLFLAGIIIQTYNGYYQFEIDLYFFHLYLVLLPLLIIWSFLAVFIHSLFANLYLGLFMLIVIWIGIGGLPQLGIETYTLLFNSPPELLYSDMNGYGGKLKAYFLVEAYWLQLGLVSILLSQLLWLRGFPESFLKRLQLALMRMRGNMIYSMGILLACFLILGFTIYREESKKVGISDKKLDELFKDFESKYQQYSNLPQARVVDLKVSLDLYPLKNFFEATGEYLLVNKSGKDVDTLMVRTGFDEDTTIEFERLGSIIAQDTIMKFSMIRLHNKLKPGDSTRLAFYVKSTDNSLFERNSGVLHNGTFLKNDIFPRIGYQFGDTARDPSNNGPFDTNFYTKDADAINFEIVISTLKEQTALAPGYLENSWVKGNRRYFKYKTDNKIKYALGFNSGSFELKKDRWHAIDLEVYHHKSHGGNYKKMIEGLKASLEYNTEHFGPYQHREARIIEFPESEGTYATTMANSIPISEMRFITKGEAEEGKVDLAFYIPAHELTHQWWGNQLMPANAHGALMLSESITEYITLKIYQQRFGMKQALHFTKKQRERYLKGRTQAKDKETPLALVAPNAQHIAYGKGALVLNALSYFIGEKKMNSVLRRYLEKYKALSPPYPTSLELIKRLKEVTPDSLHYFVKDGFEDVVFYKNALIGVELGDLRDDTYEVIIDLETSKYSVNSPESPLALKDYLEIGFYNAKDELIALKMFKATAKTSQIKTSLEQKPEKIVLDPHYLLIEKEVTDNIWELR